MKSQSPTSPAWPAQVALDHPHDRAVRADDGRTFELEAFRDSCHARAAALRREAIAGARVTASGWPLRATTARLLQAAGRRVAAVLGHAA